MTKDGSIQAGFIIGTLLACFMIAWGIVSLLDLPKSPEPVRGPHVVQLGATGMRKIEDLDLSEACVRQGDVDASLELDADRVKKGLAKFFPGGTVVFVMDGPDKEGHLRVRQQGEYELYWVMRSSVE